jgi:hypothetical protein
MTNKAVVFRERCTRVTGNVLNVALTSLNYLSSQIQIDWTSSYAANATNKIDLSAEVVEDLSVVAMTADSKIS